MEKQPLGARGPDTGRVAPPAAPGQPLPSPRRNPTCRSLHPPRPEAPGTQPEPGEHRIPGTIFGPGGHRPRGPQRSPRASRCSRAPQSPIPVNSTPAALPWSPGPAEPDAPAGPTCGPRARQGPSEPPQAGCRERLPSAPGP